MFNLPPVTLADKPPQPKLLIRVATPATVLGVALAPTVIVALTSVTPFNLIINVSVAVNEVGEFALWIVGTSSNHPVLPILTQVLSVAL